MENKPLIELQSVWKEYQLGKVRVTVLKDINLKIFPKDFLIILGPSGSGKSTLLHLIGCLDTPSTGKVFLKGNDISSLSEDALAEIRSKEVGFVFQQFNLLPHLAAWENVALPLVFQGINKEKRREKAFSLLASLGLEKRASHRPNELSGGEQQRVTLARALVNNPEIIVADEPTGNVDSETGEKIMEIFRSFNEIQNKTIIVVTHNEELKKYGKRIIRIKDGKIILDQYD